MEKILSSKSFIQKIVIMILFMVFFNFAIPIRSEAATFDIGGDLIKELSQLLASLGDVATGALNHFMLGTDELVGSSMLSMDNPNFSDPKSYLYVDGIKDDDVVKSVNASDLDGFVWTDPKIPNILYSPEAIFSNQIGAFDVNFINPHKYTGVELMNRKGYATKWI